MCKMAEKKENLAEEYLLEGKKTYLQNHIPEAIKLLLKAKMLADSEKNARINAECANTLGVIYGAIGSLNISIDYFLEALGYAEECGYARILELARNNIGSKYLDMGQYKKAIESFVICEKVMTEAGFLEHEEEIPMVTITYLNLIDAYSSVADYEMAELYIEKITPYIKKDPQQVFTFAFEITICRMKWKMGEKDFVKQRIPKVLEMAYSHANSSNYEQNMRSLCELLQWMEEYEEWEKLLIQIEKYISCLDSVYLQEFVIKLWIQYYRKTAQRDKYTQKCVRLVELYEDSTESDLQVKVSIIDSKMDIYRIMSEHKKTEKMVHVDTLTGIGNRLKLEEDFEYWTKNSESNCKNIGMAMIDIDYFKCVNDTYGHVEGDGYIICVARLLFDEIENYGKVYRIGGDEFVLLVPNATKELLEEIARKIKEDLHIMSLPNVKSKVTPEITLSQGYICREIREEMNETDMWEEVDTILYKVKKMGRNGYLVE